MAARFLDATRVRVDHGGRTDTDSCPTISCPFLKELVVALYAIKVSLSKVSPLPTV